MEPENIIEVNPSNHHFKKADPCLLIEALRSLFWGGEFESALTRSLSMVKDYLRANFVSLHLWEEREHLLIPTIVIGPAKSLFQKIKPGEGVIGQMAADRKPLWVKDYQYHQQAQPQHKKYITSLIACPLFVEDRMYGVVSAGRHREETPFSEEEFASLLQLTDLISGCIERWKLVEDGYHAFAVAIETREPEFKGHSLAVAKISRSLAHKVGMSESDKKMIYWAALLHDIGKVGIPEALFTKPFPLNDEEKIMISLHAQMGSILLSLITPLQRAAPWLLHHHERWDGSGYPLNLKGEAIPLASRIIHIAESLHAMSIDLPYKNSLNEEEMKMELAEGIGTQWDPRLVDIVLEDFRYYCSMLKETTETPFPKELEEARSEVASSFLLIEILQDLSPLLTHASSITMEQFLQSVLKSLMTRMKWRGTALYDAEGLLISAIGSKSEEIQLPDKSITNTLNMVWGGNTYYLKVEDREITTEEKKILKGLDAFLNSAMAILFHKENAQKDYITGVYNLFSIKNIFSALITINKKISLAFLDLDSFKIVNDLYGHEVGNQTLKEMAHVIKEQLRDSDILGRYGGDEFVILLPNVDKEEAGLIMKRIREALNDTVMLPDIPPVTFSFGVAQFPEEGAEIDTLLRIADERMYMDKNRKKTRG